MTRIDISRTNRLGYAAVIGMEGHARSSVDKRLLELLKVRASVLNGCTFCVDMHIPEPRDGVGEGEHRLLALIEQVAGVLPGRRREDAVSDQVWDRAAAHFDDGELGALVLAIATINVWNRIAIATRITPPVDAKHPVV